MNNSLVPYILTSMLIISVERRVFDDTATTYQENTNLFSHEMLSEADAF